MKTSSNDIYVNGEYFKNNPHWDIADADFKTDLIVKLLAKNGVHPKEVIEVV
jgi:hypothetical protein